MLVRPKFIYALFIAIVVFGTYVPALQNDFVNWDDDMYITRNPIIQKLDWQHLKDIFNSVIVKIYVPLTSLSLAIEYHFFKDNPFIYHLDNVLLHTVVSVLVFFFGTACGFSQKASFLAAVIFGIHPMHVESVAWITERKDVLYAFFYMLNLVLYCRYLLKIKAQGYNGKNQLNFAVILFLGILSILAKPTALSLPLVWALLDWYFERPFSRRLVFEKLYCIVLFVPIVWSTYFYHKGDPFILFDSLLTWIWCFVFYIKKFFFPIQLAIFYQRPSPFHWSNPEVLGTLIFFCLFLLSLFIFRRQKMYSLCIGFYVLTIFFLLRFNFHRYVETVSDRYIYIPSVGLCLGIGYALAIFYQKLKHKNIRLVFCLWLGLTGVFLMHKTYNQIKIWRNGMTLWHHQLKVQPLMATDVVYTKLAKAYMESDQFDVYNHDMTRQIEEYFRMSIRINPKFDGAYVGLGQLYFKMKDFQRAQEYFEQALEVNPSQLDAYHHLGRLHYELGNPQKGFDYFSAIFKISPDVEILFHDIIRFYEENPKHGGHLEKFKQMYGAP